MADYDFASLSPIDFERVVRDLLQKELDLTLETFALGRDKGIDLRHLATESGDLVGQCKHWLRSGYRSLLRHLENTELPKIRVLNPDRYVLATSVPLTPSNKREIRKVLRPFVKTDSDILGQDDLNNLLGKFPEVETAHFKLWLTSVHVLRRVLQSGLIQRSAKLAQDIQKQSRLYVHNESYPRAMEILEEESACLIVGIPGIGKTMLARVLCLHYGSRDFEVIEISNDIDEGFRSFEKGRPQIFYYDDFLGQTSLAEKLNKNEDSRLVSFVELVRETPNKRFVLTTREYILQHARGTYERLTTAFPVTNCVVSLNDYTRYHRAEILYNHIYFSSLQRESIDAMLDNGNYLRVIGHRNYSPRLVELLIRQADDQAWEAHEFLGRFMSVLENPRDLWAHAYEHQLSPVEQSILLMLLTLGGEASIPDLKSATQFYCGTRAIDCDEGIFTRGLSTLEGTFVRFSRETADWSFGQPYRSGASISVAQFANPSITDFLIRLLDSRSTVVRQLIVGATFFDQCRILLRYAAEDQGTQEAVEPTALVGLANALLLHEADLAGSLIRTLESPSCGLARYTDSSNQPFLQRRRSSLEERLAFLVAVDDELPSHPLTQSLNELLWQRKVDWAVGNGNLIDALDTIDSVKKSTAYDATFVDEIATSLKAGLMSHWDSREHFRALLLLRESFPDVLTEKEIEEIQADLERFLLGDIEALIESDMGYGELEEASHELAALSEEWEVPVAEEHWERLRERIDVAAGEEYEPEYDREDFGSYRSGGIESVDDAIHNLFDSLRE